MREGLIESPAGTPSQQTQDDESAIHSVGEEWATDWGISSCLKKALKNKRKHHLVPRWCQNFVSNYLLSIKLFTNDLKVGVG
jgi:hypothetical protein